MRKKVITKVITFEAKVMHEIGETVVIAEEGTSGKWRTATITDIMVSYRAASNDHVVLYQLDGGKYVRLEK